MCQLTIRTRLGTSALLTAVAIVATAACNTGPTAPSPGLSLPFVGETATMRYFHEDGDTVDVERQEAFNVWAAARLGVYPPQPIEYRKYRSRDAMGRHTGQFNTNGFAEPERWRTHTLWPFDNHEVVHVYTAMIGRPSDFFNEGLAVSFQVDPQRGDFRVRFNGEPVHEACRRYDASGLLPRPLSRYVTSDDFRDMGDSVLRYRVAGSFVLYLTERVGLPAVLHFVRASQRKDSLATIRTRMQSSLGLSLEAAEAGWMEMLRQ